MIDPYNRAGPTWDFRVHVIYFMEAQEAFCYLESVLPLLVRRCARWILVVPGSRCIEKVLPGLIPAPKWRRVAI